MPVSAVDTGVFPRGPSCLPDAERHAQSGQERRMQSDGRHRDARTSGQVAGQTEGHAGGDRGGPCETERERERGGASGLRRIEAARRSIKMTYSRILLKLSPCPDSSAGNR